MNNRQRKKQIKQKIEDGAVLSPSEFQFIKKNCPELASAVFSNNVEAVKSALHYISAAFGEAIRNIIPVIKEAGETLITALKEAGIQNEEDLQRAIEELKKSEESDDVN